MMYTTKMQARRPATREAILWAVSSSFYYAGDYGMENKHTATATFESMLLDALFRSD